MEPTTQKHTVACTLDPIDRHFTLNFAYFPIPQKKLSYYLLGGNM